MLCLIYNRIIRLRLRINYYPNNLWNSSLMLSLKDLKIFRSISLELVVNS